MINIKLKTEFHVRENNNKIFILDINLLNALRNIKVCYQKDNTGNYRLSTMRGAWEANESRIWEPRSAGLAVIYNFLDYQIKEDSKITIIRNIKNESTKEENETEIIENLREQKIQIDFSNLPSKDVPEELAKGALKFYLIEKILKETSVEDIEQIGYNKIIPREVGLKYIEKRRQVFDDKNGKDVLRVAGFDFSCLIYFSIDFIKKDKIRIFFKSDIEKNEKIIKVLYCIGINCENTSQRIRKVKKQRELFNDGNTISYCSDWEINTIGDNKIIKDFAYQVAKNLSIFLDISEQFIRAQEFNILWDMCKTSS
jgi:hypothetical protein